MLIGGGDHWRFPCAKVLQIPSGQPYQFGVIVPEGRKRADEREPLLAGSAAIRTRGTPRLVEGFWRRPARSDRPLRAFGIHTTL